MVLVDPGVCDFRIVVDYVLSQLDDALEHLSLLLLGMASQEDGIPWVLSPPEAAAPSKITPVPYPVIV
jgi:hypothetical protein